MLTDKTASPAVPAQRLWLAAIKPPIYTVAITPIIVATAAAYGELGVFNGLRFGLFLFAAVCLIAWMNLSNDVFDSDTGIDINKASSFVNITGDRQLIFWLANGFLALGLGNVALISYLQQDWTTLGLLGLASAIAYTYQGPPFRLGYLGIGELVCFIAYVITGLGVFYSQAETLTPNACLASIWVALTTSIILFCSHFHQAEDDLAAGKRSPIVRLGTARGAEVLTYSLVMVLLFTCGLIALGIWSPWMLISFGSAPFALQLINHVRTNHADPEKVKNAKFFAVKFHFTSGILLAIAYILSYYDLSFLSVTGLTY
ncbi:2-carboxy-1,4-naphthoquinone phytyltransferase [[Limnothrix rosea] IAM M-220]|uniref:2-carboxy-1,4-naphthoquinone phytyltransferase n=1 Tax=[Limnothrix rosea] IAM M-220 TaxID=454133 RepID=UPI0009689FF9|nr:2-carboxy-1,4-naphthoquinone phytyltransferase [[Limnothrix rosea] IAM M-220]OKH16057.1 1,4-dihydroxy-2-naphthoate phytyltransferase [[Limnothrix rosea] IAM M-220]